MSSLAARLLLTAPRVGGRTRAASRSCAGETPPSLPSCVPQPRPSCRPPPSCSAAHAVRVVCCAPPRGRHLPCDPRPASKPLTCSNARSEAARRCVPSRARDASCGAGQDNVAQRLSAAAAARRLQYEEEARARACTGNLAPAPVPYAPGAARDCMRATDGRSYALPCALRASAHCAPGRVPPPPEPVPLARDPSCRLAAHADPCAHRPRVFLEVDRNPPAPPPPATPAPTPLPSPAPPCGCGTPLANTTPRGLAERIVAGLRGQQPTRRGERGMHMLLTRTACANAPAGSSELEQVMRERSSLHEAGIGRTTVPCGGSSAPAAAPPAGQLELAVPVGTTRVCVLVSLGAGGAGRAPPAGTTTAACEPALPVSRRDSWLSIKSFQKKLSGCGCDAPPPKAPGPARPAVAPACPGTLKPAHPAPCPAKGLPPSVTPNASPCKRTGSKLKTCSMPLQLTW